MLPTPLMHPSRSHRGQPPSGDAGAYRAGLVLRGLTGLFLLWRAVPFAPGVVATGFILWDGLTAVA